MIRVVIVLLCIGIAAYLFITYAQKRADINDSAAGVFATALCDSHVLAQLEQRRNALDASKQLRAALRREGDQAPEELKNKGAAAETAIENSNRVIYESMAPALNEAGIDEKKVLIAIRNAQFMESLFSIAPEKCPAHGDNSELIGEMVNAVEAAVMQ